MSLEVSPVHKTINVRENLYRPQIAENKQTDTHEIPFQAATTSDLNPVLLAVLSPSRNGKFTITTHPLTVQEQDSLTDSIQVPKLCSQSIERSIKFIPYTHPTPGKSLVLIRGKGDSEDAKITVTYDPTGIPDPKEIPRNEIKLKDVSPKLLKQVRLVAGEILNEWKLAYELRAEYKTVRREYTKALKASFKYRTIERAHSGQVSVKRRYSQTEEKQRLAQESQTLKEACEKHPFCNLHGRNTTVSYESFLKVFNEKASELVNSNKLDSNLVTNSAFQALVAYLCLRKDKKRGFTLLPHGLLN